MHLNRGQIAIRDKALLVLTLIAAGEGDHPTVKKALKSILAKLENPCDTSEIPGFPNSQPVDIIPFRLYQKKSNVQTEKKKSPLLRVFSPENEEELETCHLSKSRNLPKLRVYVD